MELKTTRIGKRSLGLSLIELMIALVIGSVIMLGAATLFLQSKISFLQDEELARLQETGRFAVRYVSRELTMSGFFGGLLSGSEIDRTSIPDPNDLSTCYSWIMNTANGVEHINDVDVDGQETGAGAVNIPTDCLAAGEVEAGTDILVVRRTLDTATVDQFLSSNPSATTGVHYLRVKNYNVEKTLERTLSGTQPSDVDLWQYSPQILYVQNAATATDGIPSLCRRQVSQTTAVMEPAECLLQGVEDLQVEFGLDDDGDFVAEQYMDFPTEAQVNDSLSARFYILIRSPYEMPGYINDKTYTLGPKAGPNNPGDRYYRRVMQSTVTLRNSEALGI